jgi:hypothetical protein
MMRQFGVGNAAERTKMAQTGTHGGCKKPISSTLGAMAKVPLAPNI